MFGCRQILRLEGDVSLAAVSVSGAAGRRDWAAWWNDRRRRWIASNVRSAGYRTERASQSESRSARRFRELDSQRELGADGDWQRSAGSELASAVGRAVHVAVGLAGPWAISSRAAHHSPRGACAAALHLVPFDAQLDGSRAPLFPALVPPVALPRAAHVQRAGRHELPTRRPRTEDPSLVLLRKAGPPGQPTAALSLDQEELRGERVLCNFLLECEWKWPLRNKNTRKFVRTTVCVRIETN